MARTAGQPLLCAPMTTAYDTRRPRLQLITDSIPTRPQETPPRRRIIVRANFSLPGEDDVMRGIADYTFNDWRRLRPLTHILKTIRYLVVDWNHMRRPARAGDGESLRTAIRGKSLLVTIAFADPQVIEWQARLVRRYVPQALYIVADNSPDDASAAAIEAVALRLDVPYVRLPKNPWQPPSRSHGIALNWMWRNVIRPGEPAAFGFIDDDLFPTAPDDPFALLSIQDFYGVVRPAGSRWFLWAGFCFYRFDRVKHLPLDFGQDWFNGLDTGGGNWRMIYRKIERASVREAETVFVPFEPGIEVADGPLQWCGSWLHEVGLMGREDLAPRKRQVVAGILDKHLTGSEPVPPRTV